MSNNSEDFGPAWNEADRLATVARYNILDTLPETQFDEMVTIAAQICGVPIALFSLVDDRRQWFKAAVGLGAKETPRSMAFCAHAIQREGLFVVGDATKDERFATNPLVNALLNLAINARDAMPNGGQLTIKTSNTRLDENYALAAQNVLPGDYVLISVSDTGGGMPPDVVKKAFDPFFTTKPIGQGTGLGLSMIYGFVKQSNGHLHIYSEVGKGTTVKLYLARALSDVLEHISGNAVSPHGDGETILVVEDDATVRLLIVDVLEELGYAHIEASDARTAIPILQSNQRADLLVTDVGLPSINGRQLAEIARQTRPDMKVLFVTGYVENATFWSGFLDVGMDILIKPFTLDALGSKVREILER